jgi:hypothetical protein
MTPAWLHHGHLLYIALAKVRTGRVVRAAELGGAYTPKPLPHLSTNMSHYFTH